MNKKTWQIDYVINRICLHNMITQYSNVQILYASGSQPFYTSGPVKMQKNLADR